MPDILDKAIYFYISNNIGHGCIHDSFKYYYEVKRFVKDISQWKRRMDNMISLAIWNLDFRVVFEKLCDAGANNRTFVWFKNPPYYVQGNGYDIPFTDQDHVDLSQWNEKLRENPRHHLLITYDDCDFVRELYKGWYILPFAFSVSFGKNVKSREYHELLISNRPIKRYSFGKKTQTNFEGLVKKVN